MTKTIRKAENMKACSIKKASEENIRILSSFSNERRKLNESMQKISTINEMTMKY